MLAVIKTGGKQYKVRKGDFFSVEKLPDEVGQSVEINDVLMKESDGKVVLGNPLISGAKVVASVIAQKRRGTVLIFKKSHRKNYRRKNGHRQPVTVLKVEEIKH